MVGIQSPRALVPGRFARRLNRFAALVSDSDSPAFSGIGFSKAVSRKWLTPSRAAD